MSDVKRVGDLEIGQDLAHQRLEWKIERVGWILMALLGLPALVGLLGPGPLSSTSAGEKGSPLSVENNRFERYQSLVFLLYPIFTRRKEKDILIQHAPNFNSVIENFNE
jgi:hypothetical protein